jgi:putative transposase
MKKNIDSLEECDHNRRLRLIDVNFTLLSISRQTELLGISRSSYYYTPVIDPERQAVLRRLDALYTDHPFLWARRMSKLLKAEGYNVGRFKVIGFMQTLGIQPIYPHKNTSIPNKAHKKYPYLLRDMKVTHANQVWSTDITYIRIKHGFIYLVAVIDWYSRKVLSWRVSNSMDTSFCIEALNEAIENYGVPEIFNTDQGSQFTSIAFTSILESHKIQISMDGRGRWADNIFVERLWRTIKYEEVYLKEYASPLEAIHSLKIYLSFYNTRRPHQSLDYRTPQTIYIQSIHQKQTIQQVARILA